MAERVDKSWQKKGLGAFSTEALLGTLKHYGLEVDEASFRAAAEQRYPAQLALEWLPAWKGTGQFSSFPYPAAQELYRRLFPDRMLPDELAAALAFLLTALLERKKSGTDATAAFERAEALVEKIPPGEAGRAFLDEVLMQLGEKVVKAVDELGEALALAGLVDEARRFTELEERVLPERRGIATALVQAVVGERDQAVEKLRQAAGEEGRPLESKVMAVEALVHLGEPEEALRLGSTALDAAEAQGEHHAALALAQGVEMALVQLGREQELTAHRARTERIVAAHHHAHPHHH